MPARRIALLERLLSRIVLDGSCWAWAGVINPRTGYGTMTINGRRGRIVHRVAYEALVGPIPAGLQVDHLCRNRRCINPEHLEPVTASENTLRSYAGRR